MKYFPLFVLLERKIDTRQQILVRYIYPGGKGGGGGYSTLIRRVCSSGVSNLPPCGKTQKLYLVLEPRMVILCPVLHCIVSYRIGGKDHIYALLI